MLEEQEIARILIETKFWTRLKESVMNMLMNDIATKKKVMINKMLDVNTNEKIDIDKILIYTEGYTNGIEDVIIYIETKLRELMGA